MIVHGDSPKIGKCATEYKTWSSMIQRCTNPNEYGWRWYGAKGIKVCKRWLRSYKTFLADMGRKPSTKYTIDRINGNGDYKPSNCRWATRKEQEMNKKHGNRYYQEVH